MTQAANLAALSSYITASSTGLIGIGTASPNEKVEIVNGNLRFTGNQSIIFQNNTGASQAAGAISFKNGAGNQKAAIGSYYNIPAEGNIEFLNGSTTNMVLDPYGYLGLNVTPSAWSTSSGSVTALQLSQGGAFSTSINGVDLSYNNYNNSVTNSTYIANSYATIFRQTPSGQFQWFVAPTGTQGTSISYNQALTLDNNGNMAIAGSPYSWPASWKSFQIGSSSQTTNSALSFVNTGVNGSIYWNSYAGSSNDIYAITGYANKMTVSGGQYNFYTAASGSASGAISFTPAMVLSNANKLTVTGGIAIPTTSTTLAAVGGSLLLTSSNYLSVPTASGNLGSGAWTVECWWKSNGTEPNYATIIGQNLSGSPSSGTWAFKANNSTSGQNYFTFTWGNLNDVISNVYVNDGNWHHLAAVSTGSVLKLFVDGVQATTTGSTAITGTIGSTGATTYIGYDPRDSTYANGYITNLRIVSGTAIYSANFVPPTAALTAITGTILLLNVASSSAYITDSSTNNFTLTVSGSVPYNNFTPLYTGALVVNGGIGASGNMLLGGNMSINGAVAITGSAGFTTSYTVQPTDTWLTAYSLTGTCTLTLPTPASNAGRMLFVRTQSAQLVNSASNNVTALASGGVTNAILTNTAGKWALLFCDGSYWNIFAAN